MSRALFEGVRELQQAALVAVAADDLHAHRQASGVKPHGTEIAGWPVTVIAEHDRIQSR